MKGSEYWEIDLDGPSFAVRWGRVGGEERRETQSFGSAAKARKKHDQLVAGMRAKGFCEALEPDDPVPSPTRVFRDEALEAAIRTHRGEEQHYLVYADWLQSQGDRRGELIAVQHALSRGRTLELAKREEKLLAALGLESARPAATFHWKWGFWDWLRLEHEDRGVWRDQDHDPLLAARRLFAAPACAALRELRIGVLRWGRNHEDVPAVLHEAGWYPWAADLERLHLGDVVDVDLDHYVVGAVGQAVSAHFPGLRSLVVHSGSHETGERLELDGLELLLLEELAVETCSLSAAHLASLFAADLPSLTALDLWFGSARYGCDCDLDPLSPLLDGLVFPGVTRLGLRNAEFEDELARAIGEAPIAERLESLDLSMGTLGDDGARSLAAQARRFPNLKRLDVSRNFLGPEGIAALQRAFPAIDARDQKVDFDGDPARRYVSAWE
ncbi:MAG: TIGR02996 domain-containing protein [Myxococcales bacterium]